MCVPGGVCPTMGPYVTYCMVWLPSYQCTRRKAGQLSTAFAQGQSAGGQAHKAAPELEMVALGLYYSTGSCHEKGLTKALVGLQRKVAFTV